MKRKFLIQLMCIFLVGLIIYPTVIGINSTEQKENHPNNISTQTENNTKVSIILKGSNPSDNIVKKISIEEANLIKNELLGIEKEYEAEEKIRKQIEVLHENNLLPESFKFDSYLNTLEKLKDIFGFKNRKEPSKSNRIQPQQVLNTDYIFSGPSIESTFTLGGQTYQLKLFVGDVLEYYFDIELFDYQDNDTLNGTHFHSSAYSGPVFVGISPASAFITTIGAIISGPAFIYAPFINIRVLFSGLHLSAKIFECQNPITVFDWHLNIALMGVLIYQSN